jgi:cell division protein FtsQ
MSRPSLARLLRPLPATGLPLPGPARGRRAASRWEAPRARSLTPPALLARLWGSRRRRLALLCAVLVLPLLGAGWTWFRGSSFVAVRRVQIVGVSGPGAPAIEGALTAAARRMSTLEFSTARLREAVAAFPLVSSVRATPSFPHGVRIEVVERVPVAVLVAGGTRTVVAADGVALGPGLSTSSLPTVAALHAPAAGGVVSGAEQRAALVVLGAAPAALLQRVQSVYYSPRGLTAAMRGGLIVYFGDATQPAAKWLSLARVLADPSSAGASYVDVRVPMRPAAGFPAGVAPSTTPAGQVAASGESHPTTGGSTVAALAEKLEASSPGASSRPATSEETGSSAPAGEATHTSESATEGNEAAGTEAAAGGSAAAPETSQQSSAQAAAGGTEAGGSSPGAAAAAGTEAH